jgi:hypothetical protein
MVELAPHDPEIKQLLQGFATHRLQALQGMITQAQAAGEIRPGLEPHRLAVALMIAFAGSATMIKGFMPGAQIEENLKDLIDSWT